MRAVVVEMGESESCHPGDEEIENYSLGILPAGEIPTLEQHVLICAACQDRVAETDRHVQAMRAEGQAIRLEEKSGARTMGQGSGRKD